MYSKTEFGLSQKEFTRSPHAVLILRDVLESPAMAKYPAKFIIRDYVDGTNSWPLWSLTRLQSETIEISDAIAQSTDLLSAKLDACPYIRASDKQRWKGEIC